MFLLGALNVSSCLFFYKNFGLFTGMIIWYLQKKIYPLVNVCTPTSHYIDRMPGLEKCALKYHQNADCCTIIFQTWKNKETVKQKLGFKPNGFKSLKMSEI